MFPRLLNPLILAPMEDVTSLGFRLLCRKYGDAMAYTEQTSSIALLRNNAKSVDRAKTCKEDKPVGLQLFGRNPETLVSAVEIYGKDFDVIDLNLGCPSRKIVEHGYGSALLKEKKTIKDIISYMVDNLDKPVTVKMRAGFKKIEALELVRVMEKAGISAVTIHARTKEQGYSGKADWKIIKEVKRNVGIPVIGNGDVKNGRDAERMLEICDYAMIGRMARDNPMIFKNILHYLKTGEELDFSIEDRIKVFNEYCKLESKYKLLKLRAIDWTKGLIGGEELRNELHKIKCKEDLERVFITGLG